MDTKRLQRLTVAGWALLVSFLMQSWILGAPFPSLDKLLVASQTLAVILVAVATGPLLGLLVYLVTEVIIRLRRRGTTHAHQSSRRP